MAFKDYDALAAEKEPFCFRVGGRDLELPAELPAKLVLDVRRKARQEMTEADQEDFGFQLIEQIIGAENWGHVVEHIGIAGLGELVQDVFSHYGLGGEDEAPKAEAQEEPSELTTSLNTGERSTLTSSAFGLIPGGLSTTEPSPGPVSSAG